MIKKAILIFLCLIILNLPAEMEKAGRQESEHLVFDDLKDEYNLASYFLSHKQKKYYKKLDDQDKWQYLEAFWKSNDLDPTTDKNEFLDLIKLRIAHANTYFTHFNPGWHTDRGRIFIKFGNPYEIMNLKTGPTAKYPQKDISVWKYRISDFSTYIFIDLQQHGDFRLIYSDNDPEEGSWSDWHDYLGIEFDMGLLY